MTKKKYRRYSPEFTWFTSDEEEQENSSVVTLTIEPDGNGCIATIVHSMDVQNAKFVPQCEKGWGSMLGQIGEAIE